MDRYRKQLLRRARSRLNHYTTLNDISRLERTLEDVITVVDGIIRELDKRENNGGK